VENGPIKLFLCEFFPKGCPGPLALRARHSRAFSVLLNSDVALFKELAAINK
jgi:hypothetical protein